MHACLHPPPLLCLQPPPLLLLLLLLLHMLPTAALQQTPCLENAAVAWLVKQHGWQHVQVMMVLLLPPLLHPQHQGLLPVWQHQGLRCQGHSRVCQQCAAGAGV